LPARPRSPVLAAHTKACRTTAPDQPADLTGTPPERATPIAANCAITDRDDRPCADPDLDSPPES